MKIRQGFVSNSSSSSFIVVGKEIGNPAKALGEGKKVMVFISGAGTSGEAEDWSMFLSKSSLDLLKASPWFQERNPVYIEVNEKASSSWDPELYDYRLDTKEDVSGHVFAFYRDYSSPDNLKELRNFLKKVD